MEEAGKWLLQQLSGKYTGAMLEAVLGQQQREAWGALLVSHARLTTKVDKALVKEGFPSLDVYDVLLALEDAPDGMMRMTHLAERVVFSKSGLTRLIDRLAKAGLVTRECCPHDRRVHYARVTSKGLSVRAGTWPRYASLIQEHFGKALSDDQAAALAESLQPFTDLGQLSSGPR